MPATVRRYEGIDEVRSEEVTRKVGENLLDETLCERVDELLGSHKREPLLSTTGSRALIEELAARCKGLEEAIREIALEVQEVAASQKGISGPSKSVGGGDRLLDAARILNQTKKRKLRRKTMQAKSDAQTKPGDVVVVHGHTTGDPGRTGVILEVIDAASDHEHYRVCWDEEHESLYWPGSDATVRPGTRPKRRAPRA